MCCPPASLNTGASGGVGCRPGTLASRALKLLPPVLLALASVGCTGSGALIGSELQRNTALPESVELEQTPFFPQEDYQCGPAALAMVLTDSGIATDPEFLVEKVYIPDRRGSLQVELLAAARSLGRLPYVLEPELGMLMAELAAGRPVLVLQNLGFGFAPVWHYAVVAGYDAATDEFVLRSGTTERRVMSAAKFSRTWAGSDNWALVVLRPGELPATPTEKEYLEAAAALESVGQRKAAMESFRGAAKYWPQSSAALFFLGNSYYSAGDPAAAEQSYRQALQREPDNPAILNNLSQVLLDQGRCAEALEQIERALAAPDPRPGLEDALADSRAAILQRCPGVAPEQPAGT